MRNFAGLLRDPCDTATKETCLEARRHMNIFRLIDPLYVISGFAVGVLVGMTGVGGGSLMTPLLILLFGVHPTTAVGTDLLFAASTKVTGTIVHAAARTVDWILVGLLAIGSVPATIATLAVLSQ